MILNDLWARVRRHVERLDALYLLGLRIHAMVHLVTYLFTYLHSWLRKYKAGDISEMVEDRARVTINGKRRHMIYDRII